VSLVSIELIRAVSEARYEFSYSTACDFRRRRLVGTSQHQMFE